MLRPGRRSLALLLVPLTTALACKKDDPEPARLSIQTDLGTATASAPLDWPGVAVTPNLDDDDEDGESDFGQKRLDDGDDDYAELSVLAGDGFDVVLQGGENVRVWYDGQAVLTDDGDSASFRGRQEAVLLEVEVGEFLATSTLLFTDKGTGEIVEVPITGSPLILNHHVQPAELVMSVSFAGFGYNNQAMIEAYEEALGERFLRVSGNDYQDPWIQDEIEFATSSSPTMRLDLVIDSIRDGQYGPGYGLDDFPEDEFLGDGWAVRTWGRGYANGQDYFGNLEVAPPVTVGGVEYPYGRAYYGVNGNLVPDEELVGMLEGQAVQAPFTLDVSWLCVGHVDEFVTTVPAPGSRLGWKLLYSDVDLAWEVLEGMDPATELPRYQDTIYKPWDTIGDMVEDEALRELNEELKVDYLAPNLEILKAELALTDDDIIMIPGLFEEVSGCYGTTAAAFPGMANLVVAEQADGTPTLFVADPFLREDEDDVESDPMAMAMAAAMPDGVDVIFLDDWQVYHLNLGEVHCGSNVVRTPDENTQWWVEARHLLEAR